MNELLLNLAYLWFEICLSISVLLIGARMLIGPDAHDRIASFDLLYNLGAIYILFFSIKTNNVYCFDIVFLISLLGFVSTLVFSKCLLYKKVIDL